VLLTSTVMPGAIRGLSRRLVNRIHGGLCVAIDLPEIESRRAFIEHILTSESFRLTSEQIDQIANDYAVPPRELLGLIGQLKTESQVLGRHQKRRTSTVAKLIEERTPVDEKTLSKLCRLAAS